MGVSFIGDPMYISVKDYEMIVLVKVAVYIFDWFNVNVGFVSQPNTHLHGNEEEIDLCSKSFKRIGWDDTKSKIPFQFAIYSWHLELAFHYDFGEDCNEDFAVDFLAT